ncbi:adenosine deaminase [Thalassotalea sp. PP2-459]|uniref:adenosine deaminase n=1 Tax=Thalassotalea sp. PP2-459 TaxID=1742724 RepID=UPI0009456B08|nr:adenosine deaminase [Thalassotalea sp. PP2-459]OKY27786.1 adenosine deaminase [Thalassotalea sp. PP2-459]
MLNNTLPLIDLHRHLDGNIRPSTIWQLAQQHNISLPVSTIEHFMPLVQIQESEPDLLAFLKKLDWGVAVLATLEDCQRVAYENIEDLVSAGIDYAELRFSPYYMAMNHQLPIEGVIEAVADGVNQAKKLHNVEANLIGILSRTFGQQKCMDELSGILTHKDKFVAVDLAGDEYNYPGDMFTEHFNKIKQTDLQVTVHAGEAAGSESIWQAIKELGASRIGHGVACQHDNKLLEYMIAHNIAIESCLTSNYQTGTITNLANHPLPVFLDKGLLVTLNTDDPAVENTELIKEYKLASSLFNLQEKHITQLQQNSVDASFLSTSARQALLNKTAFNHLQQKE